MLVLDPLVLEVLVVLEDSSTSVVCVVVPLRPVSVEVTWITGVKTPPWLMCSRLGWMSMVRVLDPLGWTLKWMGIISFPSATTFSCSDDPSV